MQCQTEDGHTGPVLRRPASVRVFVFVEIMEKINVILKRKTNMRRRARLFFMADRILTGLFVLVFCIGPLSCIIAYMLYLIYLGDNP